MSDINIVSSIWVWDIPAGWDLCCACSSCSGICNVKSLQLRSRYSQKPWVRDVILYFQFFQVELVIPLNHRENISKICHRSFVAFLWLLRPTIYTKIIISTEQIKPFTAQLVVQEYLEHSLNLVMSKITEIINEFWHPSSWLLQNSTTTRGQHKELS